jgi:hypothetical protein
MTLRATSLTCVLFLVACSTDVQDHYGGGTFQVTIDDGGALSGVYDLAGASQSCLNAHNRTFCTEPMLTVANYLGEGSDPDTYFIGAYLEYPATSVRPDCFGDAPLELYVSINQALNDGSNAFLFIDLEDPDLSDRDPNADQGGPTSPAVSANTDLGLILPTRLSGSVSATLELTEDRNCPVEPGSTLSIEVDWAFDASVMAGGGSYALDEG